MYDENLIYFIIVLALFAVLFFVRMAAHEWASGKVSLIMLSVEKKLNNWAKEKVASGKDKRTAAERTIIEKFYPMLPGWLKLFITEEWLIEQIDKLYTEMLDYFDDGKLNDSIE